MARRKERADVNTAGSTIDPYLITRLSNEATVVKTTGHKALVPRRFFPCRGLGKWLCIEGRCAEEEQRS